MSLLRPFSFYLKKFIEMLYLLFTKPFNVYTELNMKCSYFFFKNVILSKSNKTSSFYSTTRYCTMAKTETIHSK